MPVAAIVAMLYVALSVVLFSGLLQALVSFGVLGFCLWIASRELHNPSLDRLEWSTATGWSCQPYGADMQVCTPHVVLDLQRLLLLRVTVATGRSHWVWMRRRNAQQWHRFRCALFAGRQP